MFGLEVLVQFVFNLVHVAVKIGEICDETLAHGARGGGEEQRESVVYDVVDGMSFFSVGCAMVNVRDYDVYGRKRSFWVAITMK
jgi:hypothetical protein